MELSTHILDEAENILRDKKQLPCRLESAPYFYVTEASDSTIQAFGAFFHEGESYKIGTKK